LANNPSQHARAALEGAEEIILMLVFGAPFCKVWTQTLSKDMLFILHSARCNLCVFRVCRRRCVHDTLCTQKVPYWDVDWRRA